MAALVTTETDIKQNLSAVGEAISAAAAAASRPPSRVTLIAISKAHPTAAARQALEAGHWVFGENKVQEALDKWPALKEEFADAELHLINRVAASDLLGEAKRQIHGGGGAVEHPVDAFAEGDFVGVVHHGVAGLAVATEAKRFETPL